MQWVDGLALRSPPSPNGTDSFNRREFGSSIFLGPPPQEGEAALLFIAPGSKEKPAPRWTASYPLGIAQVNGVSLHPEPDCRAKD